MCDSDYESDDEFPPFPRRFSSPPNPSSASPSRSRSSSSCDFPCLNDLHALLSFSIKYRGELCNFPSFQFWQGKNGRKIILFFVYFPGWLKFQVTFSSFCEYCDWSVWE